MSPRVRTSVALAAALALAGCSSPPDSGPTDASPVATVEAPAPTEAPQESDQSQIDQDIPADSLAANVPWDDYAPEVRANIDKLIQSRDCDALSEQIEVASQHNDATMSRTGHDNTQLGAYIAEGIGNAGCPVYWH